MLLFETKNDLKVHCKEFNRKIKRIWNDCLSKFRK